MYWRKSTERPRYWCARGKTDAEGRGATLYLARDTVQLLKTWLDRGGVDGGRVFRSVRKDGTVGEQLDASQVPRIYKRMARRPGSPATSWTPWPDTARASGRCRI